MMMTAGKPAEGKPDVSVGVVHKKASAKQTDQVAVRVGYGVAFMETHQRRYMRSTGGAVRLVRQACARQPK